MWRLFLIFLLVSAVSKYSGTTTIYFFPGQGSDERLFSGIQIIGDYKVIHVSLPIPEKKMSLTQFAKLISTQIDTSEKYIFIGVSLGGMICMELAEILKPEKIILISSAKTRKELPWHYRFQKAVPLNKIVPGWLTKAGAQFLQPIVEPDRKKFKTTFKSMLKSKSPAYYKRTVNMIINWDRVSYSRQIYHIHGNSDHTLPVKNIQSPIVLKKGSHLMTLTKSAEVSQLINEILRK